MQVSSTGNFLSVYRHLHTGTFLILPCRKDCLRLGHLSTRPNPHRLLPEKNSRAVTKNPIWLPRAIHAIWSQQKKISPFLENKRM